MMKSFAHIQACRVCSRCGIMTLPAPHCKLSPPMIQNTYLLPVGVKDLL
jgi:hypothetical protein